ncbi:polynucleotide kinase [Antrihabitans sp. YC2-6]|uniref:phosphatase domain-containing protein n=1 Tax=Antrihabitans sp. YC2-6 TaxID=2799498 RepID=UPI0018F77CAE|nr:polynucleotide kinase [Antrihabitans sp. YC2-6]MBJ8343960.1 polynucleotide kinase [Antrihabitans sp. YC2-6]
MSLPDIVLCDIDGTLAHMTTRQRFGKLAPYAWKFVGEDELDLTVYGLLCDLRTPVVLMSGRDDVCRPETEAWLTKNGVEYEFLLMRPAGDTRKDSVIKRELYEQHVKGKYNVRLVLDDRNQVVDMWRNELGLRCLQVAEGDF